MHVGTTVKGKNFTFKIDHKFKGMTIEYCNRIARKEGVNISGPIPENSEN